MEEKRIDRIEDKLDKVLEHQAAINTTLAAQHESLKDHIRRTEILEAIVEDKIEPMEHKWAMVKGAGKIVGGIAALAGIVEGLAVFLEYLKK